jgi:hypothetical protein
MFWWHGTKSSIIHLRKLGNTATWTNTVRHLGSRNSRRMRDTFFSISLSDTFNGARCVRASASASAVLFAITECCSLRRAVCQGTRQLCVNYEPVMALPDTEADSERVHKNTPIQPNKVLQTVFRERLVSENNRQRFETQLRWSQLRTPSCVRQLL